MIDSSLFVEQRLEERSAEAGGQVDRRLAGAWRTAETTAIERSPSSLQVRHHVA
jgi:hypothetical protein